MKQVTGSNQYPLYKDVSIQFTLGGHSFSALNLPQEVVESEQRVLFEIATPRVTLVPHTAFDNAIAADYLAAVGLACRAGEVTVCSEMQAPMVAVMAIDKHLLDQIVATLGKRACFASPLLDESHDNHNCLYVQMVEGVCFARLINNGLQIAEAWEAKTAEDALYGVAKLYQAIPNCQNIPIYIKGNAEVAKLLKKYFKEVVCE